MIGDLNDTLKQILIDHIPLNTREVDIVFDPPNHEWSASIATPTINCYLYHLQENQQLRNSEWERQRPGERGEITRKRPPARIEMHYMITVWAAAIEDEHRLIWRILSTLMRYQHIPQEVLKGELVGTEWPVPIKVAQPEGMMKNPSDFWSGFETFVKPAIQCVFTLPLDFAMSFTAPPVLSRSVRVGQLNGRYPNGGLYSMAGYVLAAAGDRLGVPGVATRLLERGMGVQTDIYGRFVFDGLPSGLYTLEARADKRLGRKQVRLPGDSYDVVLQGTATDRVSSGSDPEER